ncbi:MAG: DUF2937 family protein [Nitratireductor sp.]|nr:DUF2937 family protein [Nitratireductor sp.]MCB1422619.1 DUF2937 family protein [Nitratireductor sp.]
MLVRSTARILTLAGALTGGAVVSQAPEFAQQYRQRIGGALQELSAVVADFDKDAAASDMTREEALTRYSRSQDRFLRDRGASIDQTLLRHARLTQQREALEAAIPLMKPFHVAQYADPALVEGAWEDFKPAVPLTAEGGIYAAGGAVTGWFLIALLFGFLGWLWRSLTGKKKDTIVIEEPPVLAEGDEMEGGRAAPPGSTVAAATDTALVPETDVHRPTSFLERLERPVPERK